MKPVTTIHPNKPHILWFKKHPTHGAPMVVCSCGWSFFHKRPSVQESRAAKHQLKYDASWATDHMDPEAIG